MLDYKYRYSFDGAAITVTTDDPDRKTWAKDQRWIPCEHLKPLLISLVAKGAQIDSADTGWTKAKLVINLNKGLNPIVSGAVAKNRGVSYYQNNDPHYLVAYGWFCETCAQGLEWPQQQATMDAI